MWKMFLSNLFFIVKRPQMNLYNSCNEYFKTIYKYWLDKVHTWKWFMAKPKLTMITLKNTQQIKHINYEANISPTSSIKTDQKTCTGWLFALRSNTSRRSLTLDTQCFTTFIASTAYHFQADAFCKNYARDLIYYEQHSYRSMAAVILRLNSEAKRWGWWK